jgi:hypothetical protein
MLAMIISIIDYTGQISVQDDLKKKILEADVTLPEQFRKCLVYN